MTTKSTWATSSWTTGIVLAATFTLNALSGAADTVVSFGVEAGQPTVETIGGLPLEASDVAAVETPKVITAALPPAEDIDAYHFLPTSSLIFSTTTAVLLDGVTYGPGDVIEYDGRGYSLFFDGGDLVGSAPNIDALSILPNGDLLISTTLSAEVYGFAFLNGDVVRVDPVGQTAGLYMGLDEATLFTGANQDIDALHYDDATDNLLVSVRTAGIGAIAGLPYSSDDGDVFELVIAGTVSATTFLDGEGLFDGATRQVDAVWLPEPAFATVLPLAFALSVMARRRR